MQEWDELWGTIMGVDLGDLFERKEIEFSDLKGKIIAIDAYNTLYQFLSIIRQRDGTPLIDSHGEITSHLSGFLYRTTNLSLIHISEPTRLGMISYAVFCLKKKKQSKLEKKTTKHN